MYNLKAITFVLFTIWGCKSKEKNEIPIKDKIDHHTQTTCDSVSWLGVGFDFEKTFRIDSVSCIRNNSKNVVVKLFKNEEANRIQISDTFLYENEYTLSIFSKKHKILIPIEKITFESKAVYGGKVCSLTSCVFNHFMIKDDAGIFKIKSELNEN